MNNITDIRNEVAPSVERLNAAIAESLALSNNVLLNKITLTYLQQKGKQIRPLLLFLFAHLLSEPNEKTINGAAALELLHNASLIHDDVVDNSCMRRNVPTINNIWDNKIAVLVGDYFVTTALSLAIKTTNIDIISSICSLGKNLTMGELDQIYNVQSNSLSEEAYVKMIELKTASLFVSCAEIACASVNASDDHLQRLKEFARLLGICFQIKDDTFDYFPQSQQKLGKPAGADLKDGKISLPLLHVLLEDKKIGKTDMIQLSFKENHSEDEILKLLDYARSNGGIEYADIFMENMYNQAKELMLIYPESETKKNLLALFRYVIERNH